MEGDLDRYVGEGKCYLVLVPEAYRYDCLQQLSTFPYLYKLDRYLDALAAANVGFDRSQIKHFHCVARYQDETRRTLLHIVEAKEEGSLPLEKLFKFYGHLPQRVGAVADASVRSRWVNQPGYCYLEMIKPKWHDFMVGQLGAFPHASELLTVFQALEGKDGVDVFVDDVETFDISFAGEGYGRVCHAYRSKKGGPAAIYESMRRCSVAGRYVGALISDLLDKSKEVTGQAEMYFQRVISSTNDLNEDASENYSRLGDIMEDINSRGGFAEIARSRFSELTYMLVSRWADKNEASAAARLAASLVYNEEPWSTSILEDACDVNESEDDKQQRLASIAGMFLVRKINKKMHDWKARKTLKMWKADILGPARAFCRAIDVDPDLVDRTAEAAVTNSIPALVTACSVLKAAAVPAVKVLATVASGGVMAAGVVAAAGLVLDWYYADVECQKLGPDRVTEGPLITQLDAVQRLKKYHSVAAVLSDEWYDTEEHTNFVRIDPFFFTIRKEISQLKDDTAATRLTSNAFLAPLLNTIGSNNKTVILLPASVSDESARHIQRSMPNFYFRIVDRNHSHGELWAVRRGFEMMVAQLLCTDVRRNVVLIGSNPRQSAKMPWAVANYGPILTGRDDARHDLSYTAKQRNFHRSISIPTKFEDGDVAHVDHTAVGFYSLQDTNKEVFLKAMIAKGMRRAYVSLNIPIIMMDDRIKEYDDTVLNVRYVRRGNVLSMSPLAMPVAGYDNDFDATMSWVKPHRPIRGYDVTVGTICHVGTSYLLELSIGSGPQEAHDTIWKMPDAGHYVLNDLTRECDESVYYTVPSQKFDQTVKFVVQLNGAKNVYEATAGRILGLEAQIKIGDNILERAWNMTHRQFVSTVVHAMVCAGLDKSDALIMLQNFRQVFTERETKTWLESVISGYTKLFGFQVDNRIPKMAARGRNDYDVVTNWTSRQKSGVGFSEPFNADLKRKDYVESVDEGIVVDENGKKMPKLEHKPDEGYISAEDLNNSDAASSVASGDRKDGFMTLLTKFGVHRAKPDDKLFPGFGPNERRMTLDLSKEEIASFQTSSEFDFDGVPEFYSHEYSSKSQQIFAHTFSDMENLRSKIAEGIVFTAPDRGLCSVIKLADGMPEITLQSYTTAINVQPPRVFDDSEMGKLAKKFFQDVPDNDLARPMILLDGLAGSAKSSAVRRYISGNKLSTMIVTPTRKLARDWRRHHVGTVVTKHKLMCKNLAERKMLVVDEVYAYTQAELSAFLFKAAACNVKVILLGDRKQQYEDGAEITSYMLESLNMPICRLLVSNTMPCDAVKIAVWASSADEFKDCFQTRNKIVHSIYFEERDTKVLADELLTLVKSTNVLGFKDRLGADLFWANATDDALGFPEGTEDFWLSAARVQGMRTDHALLLTSNRTRSERWLSDQRGLMYVATSRHSRSMLFTCYQNDLSSFEGLTFSVGQIVNSRLAMLQKRENFFSPMTVVDTVDLKPESAIISKMIELGALPQSLKFKSVGPIKEDWRPWTKITDGVGEEEAVSNAVVAGLSLVGDNVPYALTDAVKYPVYRQTMGLSSLRRPWYTQADILSSKIPGMEYLAVNQTSKDEILDQKNVIERTARPRVIVEDEMTIKAEGERLFKQVLGALFTDGVVPLSLEPSSDDWAATRSSEFKAKIQNSDPYGLTSYSVTSQGFLKTQVKVKLSRKFALEENYGQTVLASPAGFNAMLGPWSKMFLRNIRLCTREGVILDSGYSDKEVAREFRRLGVLNNFEEENYQADVKRQDTSHTPITLRVFVLFLKHFGVPDELADLYELHSRKYAYRSMHSGLYRGEARYNLGSGDPFTLIRNIIEVATVMVERFGEKQMADSNMIIKGDDFLSDRIMVELPVTVPEIRATQLTEDFNRPAYHAGRFFISDDVVPDPIRMISKVLVKCTNDKDRANQLAESFYDKYVHLSELSLNVLKRSCVQAYQDFEPSFVLAFLDLYMALRDRNLFYKLVLNVKIDSNSILVSDDSETDCAAFAVSHFTNDLSLIRAVRDEDMNTISALLSIHNIPCHIMTGRNNDLTKRGVWLSAEHAFAVMGMTEFDNWDRKYYDSSGS